MEGYIKGKDGAQGYGKIRKGEGSEIARRYFSRTETTEDPEGSTERLIYEDTTRFSKAM